MKKKIAIIDIGLGNIFSLYNSLKINFKDISIIKEMKNKCPYDLIIIPGVGTFKQAMQRIKLKFPFLINKNHKIKIIGICLGMHILYKKGSPNLRYFLNFCNLLIYKNYNKMIKTNIKL